MMELEKVYFSTICNVIIRKLQIRKKIIFIFLSAHNSAHSSFCYYLDIVVSDSSRNKFGIFYREYGCSCVESIFKVCFKYIPTNFL